MTTLVNVSRRHFLRGLVGTGGLLLGAQLLPGCAGTRSGGGTTASGAAGGAATVPVAASAPPRFADFDVFLSIGTDDVVRIVAHRSEMGTGIRTTLPMVLADELGADWERVEIIQADGDAKYGSQNTDGSRSVRQFFDGMRRAGASARVMLTEAAAQRWGVDPGECEVADHAVVHAASGRRLSFGELAEDAAALPVPEVDTLVLRSPDQWRYIGKGVPQYDDPDIDSGRETYGLDVKLDGMKYVMIERCPVLGGRPRSFDADAAKAVPGVVNVMEIPPFTPPHAFQPLGGVAVVADSTWAALKGRGVLDVQWDEGRNATYASATQDAELMESVRRPGRVVRELGDATAAIAGADRVVTAEYALPLLAHASMEPPCATARIVDGHCEVWAPTQAPQSAQRTVAGTLGVTPDDVTIHVTLLGGGFGRKSKPDYCAEAALLARVLGHPVQVVWTREDDIRHDYYHAPAALRLEAGLDGSDQVVGWLQRSTFPPIATTFNAAAREGTAGELALGFTDVPFDLPNLRVENGEAGAQVRIGWFRSVCNVFHAFGVCTFADEVAAARGMDPLENLLDLIGEPRILDLEAEGVEYGNYGEPAARYPIDTGRLRHVLQTAARNAGWGRSLPKGRGLGIAVHRSFLAYIANVVEVEVSPEGEVSIPRVETVIDCGLAVNPDRVVAQMEGSAVFGTSLALFGEITAENGRIVQSNFHDYPMARQKHAPRKVNVEIVESTAPPSGVGEPGVPPFAPALGNAIFAATGQRIRSLPLSKHDLSWS